MKDRNTSHSARKPSTKSGAEVGAARVNRRAVDRDAKFQALWDQAESAGQAAFDACRPPPITVSTVGSSRSFVIADYSSYEWICVRPGTSSFARWLVHTGRATPQSGGGVSWIYSHGGRGGAAARAFIGALEAGGITATTWSVLD